MVTITVRCVDAKKCELTHQEGAIIKTDAPKDIGGDASAFSPTDMVAGSLAACMLTTMAMFAERHQINLSGATASVEKHMTTPPTPRRIAKLPVVVTLPKSVPTEMRARIEAAANKCPVKASLHPEVEVGVEYRYA